MTSQTCEEQQGLLVAQRPGRWVCAFLVFVAIGLVGPVSAQNVGALGDLATKRPGREDEPTQVKVGIFLFELTDVSDAEQTYSASIIIHASWRDPRLADGSEKTRTLGLDEVWHPRVQIANERRLFARFHEEVEVEPNGQVIYRQRYNGTLVAALKLHDFPMDTQLLSVQLAFPDYSPTELEIVLDESTTGQSGIFHVADWEIMPGLIRVAPISFLKGVERASVVYEFQAKRYRGYYYWKILLPLVLIVCMSWAAFWIDTTNIGAQIGVATSSMLTLIAYRFMIGTLLPRVSYLTRLDIFILGSTILVFLTILEVVAISILVRTDRLAAARRLDFWSRAAFPLAFLILLLATIFR